MKTLLAGVGFAALTVATPATADFIDFAQFGGTGTLHETSLSGGRQSSAIRRRAA